MNLSKLLLRESNSSPTGVEFLKKKYPLAYKHASQYTIYDWDGTTMDEAATYWGIIRAVCNGLHHAIDMVNADKHGPALWKVPENQKVPYIPHRTFADLAIWVDAMRHNNVSAELTNDAKEIKLLLLDMKARARTLDKSELAKIKKNNTTKTMLS